MTVALENWPREEWGARLVNVLEVSICFILAADDLPHLPKFEKVVKLLKTRFEPEALLKLWRVTLENRKRGTQESLTELAYSILDMTIKAYPEIVMGETKKIAVLYFTNALLGEEQRIHVRCYSPRNLEETLQKAIAYKSAQKTEERHRGKFGQWVRLVTIRKIEEETEDTARSENNKGKRNSKRTIKVQNDEIDSTANQIEELNKEIAELKRERPKTLEKYRLAISNNYVAYRSKRKSHVTPGRKF